MIRHTVLILALSTSSVFAQEAATTAPTEQKNAAADADNGTARAAAAAEAAGVTGFVPLVAPTLGVVAAAAGLAAAGGGGSTTSTVSTN